MTREMTHTSSDGPRKNDERQTPRALGQITIGRYTLEGIGYLMVGGVVASFGGTLFESLQLGGGILGSSGLFRERAIEALAVGGALIFIGEFLKNYVRYLNDRRDEMLDVLNCMQDINRNIDDITKQLDGIKNATRQVAKNADPPYEVGSGNPRP